MRAIGARSIRGRVTLIAGIAIAGVMVVIVSAMGFAARAVLEDAIVQSLHERLEQAKSSVEIGDYAAAIDSAGNEMLQIIDADGKVVAGTRNARGLAPLVGDDDESGEYETDDLAFPLDDSGEDGEGVPAAKAETSPEPGAVQLPGKPEQQTARAETGEDDDLDDGADADQDDDADDDGAARPQAQGTASGRSTGSVETDDDADDADEADDDDDSGGGVQTGAVSGSGDDADDADDDDADDDDDDDRAKSRNKAKGAQKTGKTGSVSAPISDFGAFLVRSALAPSKAWADELSDDAGHSGAEAPAEVDAKSVLGAEGPYVVLKERVESPDGPMTLVAVASLASARESAQRMALMLAIVMVVAWCLAMCFTWILTGRTLKPVEAMRAKADSINASNLGDRIDVPVGDKELSRLATTLNEMLDRIQGALEEQKRFVSDASHELKSPLAATSVILDTARAHPEAVDLQTTVSDLSVENARMASVIGDMLTLTRSDEGRLDLKIAPADIMDLVLEEASVLSARSEIEIDTTGVQPVVCQADADQLRHAVRNVLENAVRYAETKVKVSCFECDEPDRHVSIVVSDDGPGIALEDRERVFGRFVCLDEGHGDSKSGTGLGLSVVKSIVEAHGGTAMFADGEIGGATIVIELPA